MENVGAITFTTEIRQNKDIIQTYAEDNLLLMNIISGKYFEFDCMSAEIWEGISNETTVSDLITELTARYEENASHLQDDVLEFLGFLAENGLIETNTPAGQ
ncbi:PqqD family protein (plasmid) [Tistrella mobilis]|uniref:PqqD family protein n=1 Tax=Tistrella mobilis TaxID=171437 RepID=UPI0035569AFF